MNARIRFSELLKTNLLFARNMPREKQDCKPKRTFICDTCKKSYTSKSNVMRHIFAVHEKSVDADHQFLCSECGKIYVRKDNLLRHMRIHKLAKTSPDTFDCEVCHRNFSSELSLQHHNYKQHAIVPDGKSFLEFYKCHDCSVEFATKFSLVRHIRKTHPFDEQPTCTNSKRKCLSCGAHFKNKQALEKHYKDAHSIVLEFEYLPFTSFADFKKWLPSYFTKEVSWTTSVDIVSRYRCHRSGHYEDKCKKNNTKRKRHLKMAGTKKLQGFCPGEVTVRQRQSDNSCIVTHQKIHVGHNINDKTEQSYIRPINIKKQECGRHVLVDLPENTIMQNSSCAYVDDIVEEVQFDLVNKRDTETVMLSYEVTGDCTMNTDSISVDTFVLENKDSILFYKGPGEKDTVYEFFRDEDTILIYQDTFQKECLLKYGHKLISFDVTRGNTLNDYRLHTMLVLDLYGIAIPVAYLICNRSDDAVIVLFIQCIQEHVGTVTTRAIMSDEDEIYHQSYQSVMGPSQFLLFSTWCIRRTWSRKLNELISVNMISAEERQHLVQSVKKKLYDLADELDEASFKQKLVSFLSINDKNAQPFLDYFKKHYADMEKNKPQFWALCYRLHAGANTGLHTRAYREVLKRTIGKERKIQTLAAGVDCVRNYDIYRRKKNRNEILRPRVPKKLVILRERHSEAEEYHKKQPFAVEFIACNQSWQVGSFSATSGIMEMFLVQKTKIKECDLYAEPCRFRCNYCNRCFHEFKCSCYDSAISNNMCIHIHALSLSKLDEDTPTESVSMSPSNSVNYTVVSAEVRIKSSCDALSLSRLDEETTTEVGSMSPSSLVNFSIVSPEVPIQLSYDYREKCFQENINYCDSIKEKVRNTMEEVLHLITPKTDPEQFEKFFREYIIPLPSILKAMQSELK